MRPSLFHETDDVIRIAVLRPDFAVFTRWTTVQNSSFAVFPVGVNHFAVMTPSWAPSSLLSNRQLCRYNLRLRT